MFSKPRSKKIYPITDDDGMEGHSDDASVEKHHEKRHHANDDEAMPPSVSEEERAGILGKLLYTFADDLFKRGWERFKNDEMILTDDLLALPSDENPEVCHRLFLKEWQKEQLRAEALSAKKGAPVEPNFFAALRTSQRRR